MKSMTSVLIVAQHSRVRDGLQALLMAMPQIEIVGSVEDVPSAFGAHVENIPSVALLDIGPYNGQGAVALTQIKNRWPATRCLVLVDSVLQQKVASSTGADEVLFKGFSAAELYATVQRLLN